jgi:hypothetical protein
VDVDAIAGLDELYCLISGDRGGWGCSHGGQDTSAQSVPRRDT